MGASSSTHAHAHDPDDFGHVVDTSLYIPPEKAVGLDPKVQAMLARVGRSAAWASATLPLWLIRMGYDGLGLLDAARLRAPCVAEDLPLEVASGPPLRARLYAPTTLDRNADAPLIIFYHGGGFCIGSLNSHQSACSALAVHTGFRVLSVEYGLGPERPYPASHDDAFSAYEAVSAKPAALGLAPTAPRIILSGDSAGGLLAISVALQVRDRNRIVATAAAAGASTGAAAMLPSLSALLPPVGLFPFYPAVDGTVMRPSRSKYAEGYVLSESMVGGFRHMWLGATLPERKRWRNEPRLHPLQTPDWENMPPTVVTTAEFDILHDEGVALVDTMRAGGARAEHVEARGLIHGFVTELATYPAGLTVIQDVCARMRNLVEEAEAR